MSRRKSDGRAPKRRDRESGPNRASGLGMAKLPTPRALPSSEISAKLAHLSESIDALPSDLDGKIPGGGPGAHATGAEATDHGLLIGSGRPTSAQVIAIDAQPDPACPGGVVIRLDGWKGPLLLTLSRDRAEVLVNRLTAAVDKVRDWYGVSPPDRPVAGGK